MCHLVEWFGRAQNCGNFDQNFDTQPLMPTLIGGLPRCSVSIPGVALLSKHLNPEENSFWMLIWIYKQYFIFRKIFGMKSGGSKFRGGGGAKQSPVDNIYIEKYLMVGRCQGRVKGAENTHTHTRQTYFWEKKMKETSFERFNITIYLHCRWWRCWFRCWLET